LRSPLCISATLSAPFDLSMARCANSSAAREVHKA
jgi:hypothetical protein